PSCHARCSLEYGSPLSRGTTPRIREATMKLTTTTLAAIACALATSLQAADVTYERLRNPEPHNWLMNHRDFAAHRFSPLDVINKGNVKNLKLKFAVSLGGTAGNE